MQDLTGIPAMVDLAAMRSAMARLGGDPQKINPLVPCDLVIDHSVQVDFFGSQLALQRNVEREYERNRSGTASCVGPRTHSRTSGLCRPARASCTRSTWSTWPTW